MRIEPEPNHALFFPEKRKNRIVIGKSINIWRWEKFKHVDLQDFKIIIDFGTTEENENPPAKTLDDLPCSVQAIFRLQLNHSNLEESIEKSTSTFCANKDKDNIISEDYFKKEVESKLETVVERTIRETSYLKLLEDPEYRRNQEKKIESGAEQNIKELGFIILGCRVDIEPIKPNPDELTRNVDLKKKWHDWLRMKTEIELEENQIEDEKKEKQKEAELNKQINERKRQNQLKEKERELEVANKEGERDKEKKIMAIDKELDQIRNQRQIDKDAFQHNINMNVLEQNRKEEEKERKDKLEEIKSRKESAENELEVKKTEKLKGDIDVESNKKKGEMEAEVTRKKKLAENADKIQINELWIKSLPAIIEKASKPMENLKLGDVKILHFAGSGAELTDGIKGQTIQPLSSIIPNLIAFPMFKEIMRFMGDFDVESQAKISNSPKSKKTSS